MQHGLLPQGARGYKQGELCEHPGGLLAQTQRWSSAVTTVWIMEPMKAEAKNTASNESAEKTDMFPGFAEAVKEEVLKLKRILVSKFSSQTKIK